MKKQIIIPIIVSTAIVAVVAAVLVYSYRNSTHTNIIASTSNSSSSGIPQIPPDNVPLGAFVASNINDCVLTCAIMEGLIKMQFNPNNGGKSTNFRECLHAYPAPYNNLLDVFSITHVSLTGWFFDNLDDTLGWANLSVIYKNPKDIGKGAEAIAAVIFLARTQHYKEYIQKFIQENFYSDFMDFDKYKDQLKNDKFQNKTYQITVPLALCIALNANNFEEGNREVMQIGEENSGEITNMACAVLEALYGMPQNIRNETWRRLPDFIKKISIEFGEKRDSSIYCENCPNARTAQTET